MIVIFLSYIFLFVISFLFTRKKINIYFFIVSLTFGIIAFFFVPDVSFDLYRHYAIIDIFRQYGWNMGVSNSEFPSLIIANGFLYLISFLPTKGFLPAITAFVTYYLLLNIIYKVAIRYDLAKKDILLAAFFFVSTLNYLGLISGIRNSLAFAIFTYFLYMDLVENRNKILCWIMYILLCFLHLSVLILLLFRIIVQFNNKFIRIIVMFFSLTWSLFLVNIVDIISRFSNLKIFYEFQQKIQIYGIDHQYNTYSYSVAVPIIILIGVLITYIFFLHINKNKYIEMKVYFNYITLIITFCIGCINYYRLIVTFVSMLCFLSVTFIALLNRSNILKGKVKKIDNFNTMYKIKIRWTNCIFTLIIIGISMYSMFIYFKYQYSAVIFKI
jgi:hypothetical protein